MQIKKYIFIKYSNQYPRLFEKEKKRILKIIPKAKIEHVGSTAVPGLGGKPIVDVMIIVSKNKIGKAKNLLLKEQYVHPKTGSEEGRLFFQKDYGILFWKRRVHVHLTYKNSKPYFRAINFRNHLREDKKAVKEYAKIKKQAVKFAKGEGQKYRDYKDKFIKKHSK